MKRFDIINYLIEKYNYTSYLEIGVENPNNCFNKINAVNKISVDPNPMGIVSHKMTSDEFFKAYSKDMIFDIVFIDGLHTMEQVDKDIQNSLNHLSENGIIVLHDCNPVNEQRQMELNDPRRKIRAWNGTVWKSIAKLRCSDNNLYIAVIDTDEGVGIIKRGTQDTFKIEDDMNNILTYEFLDMNRGELLNLISVLTFKEIL